MMLFPADPQRRPQLWDALIEQLNHNQLVFLVIEERFKISATTEILSKDFCESFIQRVKKLAVCRVSANRGIASSPHFFGNSRGKMVAITDFITTPSASSINIDTQKIKRDSETAVINLLYAHKEFEIVKIPINIQPWNIQDFMTEQNTDGLEFRRRT